MSNPSSEKLPSFLQWSPAGRAVVFFLSAASIWCLLADFYHLCSMRTFTLWILIPATILLIAMAIIDFRRGDRVLFRAVMIGAIGGLLAAIAYDIFRLPFVIAAADHVGPSWARLPLFKVFPRFGAMILGHPFDANGAGTQLDSQFTVLDHVVGWIYHLSNGITFGVMYMAIIGDATRRSWLWGIALAMGLELAMLFTPYTSYFGINPVIKFVVVTMIAHLIFGVVLGKYAQLRTSRPMLAAV